MLDQATQKAITPGTLGKGGQGGNANESMNQGSDGIAGPCWDFVTNVACGM